MLKNVASIVVVLVLALAAAGCSTDAALRDKSLEFTLVNEGRWERQRRKDLPADTVSERRLAFAEHRNVGSGKVDAKLSGAELKAQTIGIVDEQEKILVADWPADLPALFKEIQLDEFRSQRDVLRGK